MNSASLAAPATAPRSLVAPALLACYVIWGSTYLAIRFALEGIPPFLQMGTRFLVAGSILMAWALWRGAKLPTIVEWRNAGIVGALMLGGGMGLTALSEVTVGSGLIAAFIAIAPMVMCACALAVGQRPSRFEVAGMAVGLAGVLLLVRGESFSASPLAMFAIFMAVVTWSIGSILSTSRTPLAPGAMGFASEMLCGGAVLMVVSLAMGEHAAWPLAPRVIAAWVYLVVFGSLVAFSAYMYLLSHASPALASSYAFVNPVIALVLGVLIGGEAVSGAEWIACGVVLVGVVLLFMGKKRVAPE